MKTNFGTQLSRSEMKNVFGGTKPTYYCGSTELDGCCNAYCDNTACSGTCSKCEDAGNGDGGDGKHKICYQF